MAKKKKTGKHLKIGRVRVPKQMVDMAVSAFRSPVGKIVLAEALVQTATLLATRHPTAAATAAGAGAASAAKDAIGGAGSAVAKLMHSAAELLRDSIDGGAARKKKRKGREKDVANRAPDESPSEDGEGSWSKSRGEILNRDTIREVLVGAVSGQKARKKAKHASRH